MNITQSSPVPALAGVAGHPDRCSKCSGSLYGRHYHRISQDGGPTQVWCCVCYFDSTRKSAGWHPECNGLWEKSLPPRKFADGSRVRHLETSQWRNLIGQEATIEKASFAGLVSWSYALNGPNGIYAWVDEADLEAVSSPQDTREESPSPAATHTPDNPE